VNLPADQQVEPHESPPTFYTADAASHHVRARTLRAAGAQLAVGAPVLAVDGVIAGGPGHQPPAATFPAEVYFDLAQFEKVSRRSRGTVSKIATTISGRETVAGLRIDGHADDLGPPVYNLRLSRRRSCYVARELRRLLGPAAPPFEIRAFGEARPSAPNIHPDGSDDPHGRAQNRRVEVVVLSHEPARRPPCPSANRGPGRA
jgi:outer membrane protein OmpA-like peptidoglycan-associated protein